MTNANDPINGNLFDSQTDATGGISSERISEINKGLTKREYFAAMRKPQEGESAVSKAAAEVIMGEKAPTVYDIPAIKWWAEAEEKLAVIHADALIKALNQTR